MKKKLFIVAILAMVLLLVFAACAEKEPEPLRICIDLGYVNSSIDDLDFQKMFLTDTLITNMLYAGKTKNVDVPREFEIEYIFSEGVEREMTLDHMRTEIMAGGGPDLFIVACNTKNPLDKNEALFPMPEKAMELSIFMPLDEYMENNTYFAEWDRMNSTVLAAGRTDEGQQIIPLCYTIPVAVYRAEDVEHTASKETTWMDMIESENEALRAAAVWTDNTGNYHEGMPFITSRAPMTEFILGALADYGEEELLFTAEELEQRLHEIVDLGDRYTAGEFQSVPTHYVEFAGREFDRDIKMQDMNGDVFSARNGIERSENYTMIPLYSDDGGVTAEITAFMAINRNTKCPEDAYRVLDYLMSFSEQMKQNKMGSLYSRILLQSFLASASIPMYDELMCEGHRMVSPLGDKTGWYLKDENFEELCEVREQITNVKFRNALDKEFTALYYKYHEDVRYGGGDGSKIAAEGYRQMQRMLRE